MKTNSYKIKLKADKRQTIAFAQGERGEILYMALFPGSPVTDPSVFQPLMDRILDHDHHLKHPDEYITIKEVDQSEGRIMFGFEELTPIMAATNDMRRGIKVASAQAIKDIKG
jgi:hypothetical protein